MRSANIAGTCLYLRVSHLEIPEKGMKIGGERGLGWKVGAMVTNQPLQQQTLVQANELSIQSFLLRILYELQAILV
jgi:hypothetical protein